MGVPTSKVGYTPAMPRREDHEVHKGYVVVLDQKKKNFLCLTSFPPTNYRCKGLLVHLIILSDTYKLVRTPLDEWLARHRDLYLTTRNTHKRQTFVTSAGFKPAIPASERPQIHTLGCVAIRIG